jgi:hypothetical protein
LFPDRPAAFSGAAWPMPRMNPPVHPGAALFKGKKAFPTILLAAQKAGWGPVVALCRPDDNDDTGLGASI